MRLKAWADVSPQINGRSPALKLSFAAPANGDGMAGVERPREPPVLAQRGWVFQHSVLAQRGWVFQHSVPATRSAVVD